MKVRTELVEKGVVTPQEEDESHIRTLLEFPQKAEGTPEIGEGDDGADAPEDEPEVERSFHGGPFTAMGFSGDLSKIE